MVRAAGGTPRFIPLRLVSMGAILLLHGNRERMAVGLWLVNLFVVYLMTFLQLQTPNIKSYDDQD
jgi:hypothetical protein